MEMQLLDYYKAIEAKSADMLQAAQSHDWDAVVDCEKACGVLINEPVSYTHLRAHET